jgi:urease accessory protein
MSHRRTTLLSVSALVALFASPAAAHHPMGGATPSTLVEGLLSGLGHPVIGIDHLAFILAVGVAVAVYRLHLLTPVVFVGASAAGVALHLLGANLPAAELLVAGSVLLLGGLLLGGVRIPASGWAALFAAAGVVHGYAYGEAVVGAEAGPVWAYLAGLAVVQAMIAAGVAFALRARGTEASHRLPRSAGAAVAAVGAIAMALQIAG